jgi:predicted MPP superfamily phosphohydrolase
LLGLLGLFVTALGYWNATRDPIVREASLAVAGWSADQEPLRVLLISDIHVAGPDMPPERLRRIIDKLNRLRPDLVLIAGDMVSEKRVATHIYTPKEVVAPLAGFKSRLGTVAALGNHDHWFDAIAITRELRLRGIRVLENEAIELGPVVIGGVGDDFTGHADVRATYAAMGKLTQKPRILVTHSPDIVPALPEPVGAVFAGHTHCGQISLPLIGPISHMSRYGNRFACGAIKDRGQAVFVASGLGTSILPMRFGAPPDVWLVTLRAPG